MRWRIAPVVSLLIVACSPIAPPVPPTAPACLRVAELAKDGDHKPAYDEMTRLRESGATCSAEIELAADSSGRRVAEADALLHAARDLERSGELAGARASIQSALAVYPRYHWARRLLADLETDLSRRGAEELLQAERHLSDGDLAAASRHLEAGSALAAGLPELESEEGRLRSSLAGRALSDAFSAEKRGDRAKTGRLLVHAAAARPADPVLNGEIIEAALRVGLELFSDGELQQASSLWRAALGLDPGHPMLREYVEQVRIRLENLERIRAPAPDRPPS